MNIILSALLSVMVWKILIQIEVLQKRYSSIAGKRGPVEILLISFSLVGGLAAPRTHPRER
ncbi:NhaP-type Na+/H+ and K+/H+ antiporter [Methanofollis sp. W23]|uniref:hypothetical protein n=1 Tax=Methanofollis sp. W23 TaxID=2817849 RepID=UPI001AE2AE8B|nr:hypothetical protein [Methanofollis sp. W23]MBP2146360.1 NhaP-type Na+/H+ and K+/H+ antiporter [Methanofollis sp. W23]